MLQVGRAHDDKNIMRPFLYGHIGRIIRNYFILAFTTQKADGSGRYFK